MIWIVEGEKGITLRKGGKREMPLSSLGEGSREPKNVIYVNEEDLVFISNFDIDMCMD